MKKVQYIECTKGFLCGEGDGGFKYDEGFVMEGEVFQFMEGGDGTDFIGLEGANRFPDMEISFTPLELTQHFKFVTL